MNEAVNTRINQGFTQDDRSFLFQQFLLCIEDPSLLLRFLTISCQIFQHRKKKWTDEDMINSEESRVGGFLISVITRYLTVIRSVDTTENEEPEKYSKENYLMSQLIDRIFLKFDFSSSFIQRLFPPNPSHVSSIPSSAFVTVFSKHQLLMLLCKLIDSWGSPYFQNNAMLSRYQSLSVFILTILTSGAVIRSDLASPIFLVKGPQSAPSNESPMISVESLLVEAVSKGLESSLPLVRYYTMKIAQEYARLMEYSLEFDELKELENQNKIKQQPAKLKDEAENDSEEEEEENDEDEIQGYYISKEQDSIVNDLYLPPPTTSSDDGSLSKRKKIYYLRECLELLKAPEGSPDIRAGIILALDNLPTILQNHPYDGQNFAHPLLFQLLNLSDQYNIEEFDRLKSEAIISLVKEYPLQTLPLLNQSILNRDLPLALRIHSIQYHRIVATFFYEQNMKTIAEESMKSDTKIANFNNFDKQKTVIKRPRRYELLRKKYEQQRQEKQLGYSTVKKNVFQEYSELFISPVLQLLQQFHEHYSKGNTSTSMPSTLSLSSSEPKSFLANPIEVEKDRFNLIAEAFPEDKKPANRSTLLNDESFELTTLKLPSSTSPMKKKSESVKPLIQEINNDIDMKVTSKVENKPSQGKKSLKSSSSAPPKLPDEMDILLPYDALLSLAIYMRYSTFQNQYRVLAFVCIELSITYFKTFTMSLGLRRASLCLLMTVIEGLLNSYDTGRSSGSSLEERSKIAGVLDSLLKITALHNMEEERHLTQTASSSSSGLDAIKEELLSRTSVLELIEILLERMEQQKESDQLCQQLTVSLIKIFQEQLFSQAF